MWVHNRINRNIWSIETCLFASVVKYNKIERNRKIVSLRIGDFLSQTNGLLNHAWHLGFIKYGMQIINQTTPSPLTCERYRNKITNQTVKTVKKITNLRF